MSLRDLFAAMAMHGMLPAYPPESVAEKAYEIADSMIQAREKK